jgi:3-methylcrotonyl-CoA carboxylase beta subunit
MFRLSLSSLTFPLRDPNQHSTLQQTIEDQSTAMYSTARLWDDGIIRPMDTRNVLGLALGLSVKGQGKGTWDGDGKGWGVFRM